MQARDLLAARLRRTDKDATDSKTDKLLAENRTHLSGVNCQAGRTTTKWQVTRRPLPCISDSLEATIPQALGQQ